MPRMKDLGFGRRTRNVLDRDIKTLEDDLNELQRLLSVGYACTHLTSSFSMRASRSILRFIPMARKYGVKLPQVLTEQTCVVLIQKIIERKYEFLLGLREQFRASHEPPLTANPLPREENLRRIPTWMMGREDEYPEMAIYQPLPISNPWSDPQLADWAEEQGVDDLGGAAYDNENDDPWFEQERLAGR